jgi:hypothetical protein
VKPDPWRALTPVALLVTVACVQVTLAKTAGLSPWKGGGFGMFSTTDDPGRRHVRIFVRGPERSEEIAVPSSLEDAARRAAVLPDEARLSRLAHLVAEREQRNHRAVDEVRIEAWRLEYAPDTLTATPRRLRDFTCRVDATPPSPR